jgi:hypothetical protein
VVLDTAVVLELPLEEQDAVAIPTAHAEIESWPVVDIASRVFDARGVTKPL